MLLRGFPHTTSSMIVKLSCRGMHGNVLGTSSSLVGCSSNRAVGPVALPIRAVACTVVACVAVVRRRSHCALSPSAPGPRGSFRQGSALQYKRKEQRAIGERIDVGQRKATHKARGGHYSTGWCKGRHRHRGIGLWRAIAQKGGKTALRFNPCPVPSCPVAALLRWLAGAPAAAAAAAAVWIGLVSARTAGGCRAGQLTDPTIDHRSIVPFFRISQESSPGRHCENTARHSFWRRVWLLLLVCAYADVTFGRSYIRT